MACENPLMTVILIFITIVIIVYFVYFSRISHTWLGQRLNSSTLPS